MSKRGALCEQVLRRDKKNAKAYETLGDVFRLQGRSDDAANMYSMALQLDPRNQTVMQRLERLSRSGGPSAQRVFFDNNRSDGPAPRPGRRDNAYAGSAADLMDKRPIKTLLGGVLGYGLTFLLIFYVYVNPGTPFHDAPTFLAPISSWSVPLVVVMAMAGGMLGFTMAATAAIRRIDDELILPGTRASGNAFLPLGLILIVVSVLSFYAAALLYTIIGLLQESLTPSMMRIFGAVMSVVLLLTAIYAPGRGQVLLFGGNVIFLSLLLGWALGDFFRPGVG